MVAGAGVILHVMTAFSAGLGGDAGGARHIVLGASAGWVAVALVAAGRHSRRPQDMGWNLSFGLLLQAGSFAVAAFHHPASAVLSFSASAVLVAAVYRPLQAATVNGTAAGFLAWTLLARGSSASAAGVVVIALVVASAAALLKRALQEKAAQDVLFDQARWAASKLSDITMRLDSSVRGAENRAVSSERGRVARIVHDSVGYSLTALLVQLNALAELTAERHTREGLRRLETLVRSSLQEIREQVSQLRHGGEEDRPVDWAERWRQLCDVFTDCTGVRIHSEIAQCSGVAAATGEAVYRILQESLTNAYRHGRATYVSVSMRVREDLGLLLIKISDNGRGAEKFAAGNGLRGIRERVAGLGGQVLWKTEPERGFDLAVDVPWRTADGE